MLLLLFVHVRTCHCDDDGGDDDGGGDGDGDDGDDGDGGDDDVGGDGDGDDDNDDDATILVEIVVPSQRDQMGPEVWANAALQKRPEQVSGEFHPWNIKS